MRYVSVSVRKEIQSNRIRDVPNKSEKRFKSCSMQIRWKPIQLILRSQCERIQTKFSIRINSSSNWSKPNFRSKSIWLYLRPDWYGSKTWFGFIRIEILKLVGLKSFGEEINPSHSRICFQIWIIPNQSEKRSESHSMYIG